MNQTYAEVNQILARKPKRRIEWVQKRIKDGASRDILYQVLSRRQGDAFAHDLSDIDATRTYALVLSGLAVFTSKQQKQLQDSNYVLRQMHDNEQDREKRKRRPSAACVARDPASFGQRSPSLCYSPSEGQGSDNAGFSLVSPHSGDEDVKNVQPPDPPRSEACDVDIYPVEEIAEAGAKKAKEVKRLQTAEQKMEKKPAADAMRAARPALKKSSRSESRSCRKQDLLPAKQRRELYKGTSREISTSAHAPPKCGKSARLYVSVECLEFAHDDELRRLPDPLAQSCEDSEARSAFNSDLVIFSRGGSPASPLVSHESSSSGIDYGGEADEETEDNEIGDKIDENDEFGDSEIKDDVAGVVFLR